MLSSWKNNLVRMPRERLLLHLLLLALTVFCLGVTVSSYRTGQFGTQDVGNIDYMLYHTWHGNFFWSIVLDTPHFSKHFTPTLILLVPLHAVFRHILMLTLLETLALCSGAWAVAWMFSGIVCGGRQVGSALSTLGLAAGLCYLGSSLIGSIHLAFHFESFAVALMLWAFAALVNSRIKLFWIFWLLALGVKEDIAVYGVAFGLWLLIFQRWSLFPEIKWRRRFAWLLIAVCAAWFALALSAITWMPRATGQPLSEFLPRYAGESDGSAGLLGAILANWRVSLARIGLMAPVLLNAVLWLAVLEPAVLLLLIPPALIMGLSHSDSQYSLYYYYSYPFVPFLYLGLCLGLGRILRWSRRSRGKKIIHLLLVVVISAAGLWSLTLPTRTEGKRRTIQSVSQDRRRIVRHLRETIPPDASVAAQFYLLCYLPHRTTMRPLSLNNIERAEYWVIDRAGSYGDVSGAQLQAIIEAAQELEKQGQAEIEVFDNRLIIVHVLDFNPGK
jgi:uncharacterized membrane protein